MTRRCRIILIGTMGSGKTAVGRLLAGRTGWPLHDNDALMRHLFGATPRQVLASAGETALREAESAALAQGVAAPEPCVVTAAGGTILDLANRRLLNEAGTVVWLRASAATVEARATGAAHRPWLDTGGASWIRTAIAERDPLYASVADIVVDTDAASAVEVAQLVLDRIGWFEACGRWLLQAGQD